MIAWRNDLADQIKVDMLNEVVEDYATEVAKELGNLTCQIHPEEISTITIVPDRTHTMVINSKFCCPDFEKIVTLKIER
jgi:hypothetical protein